jgi:hypothetical protein
MKRFTKYDIAYGLIVVAVIAVSGIIWKGMGG